MLKIYIENRCNWKIQKSKIDLIIFLKEKGLKKLL